MIKEMVTDNKKVFFQYYRGKELWYKTETGFMFPVPIDDIGDATFLNEDKAILFMRYIRKHLAEINSHDKIFEERMKDPNFVNIIKKFD